MNRANHYASPEEVRYARVLGLCVAAGLVVLALSFAVYVFEILPPFVPFDQLPGYWGLSAREFARATKMPTGWGWVSLVGNGDVLNLIAIAFLAGLSAICSLAVLPMFVRRRETAQALIIILQVVVLAVAASGLLVVGR